MHCQLERGLLISQRVSSWHAGLRCKNITGGGELPGRCRVTKNEHGGAPAPLPERWFLQPGRQVPGDSKPRL